MLSCAKRVLRVSPMLAPVRSITTAGPSQKIKRFYKKVDVARAPNDQGWTVLLEKRQLKTPKGKPFVVPNEELANIVAWEWDAQDDIINPGLLYVAAQCNIVLDHPSGLSRETRIRHLLPFLETDTLSFRPSEEETEEVYAATTGAWDPVCDWFDKRFGTPLLRTRLLFAEQPAETMERVAAELAEMPHAVLAAVEHATETSKSLAIPLALRDGYLSAEEATEVARIETSFQVARFGVIEWAHSLEEADTRARLAASSLVMDLGADMPGPEGA